MSGSTSQQDLKRVRAFIGTHECHFAKTMPESPHWYGLGKDKSDIEEFIWLAKTIREHSAEGQFYGRTYSIWTATSIGGWVPLQKNVI